MMRHPLRFSPASATRVGIGIGASFFMARTQYRNALRVACGVFLSSSEASPLSASAASSRKTSKSPRKSSVSKLGCFIAHASRRLSTSAV